MIKYPLVRSVINEISGGIAALARASGVDERELKEKLAGERELSLEEAIRISDALNSIFNVRMFTPYIFRMSTEAESGEEEKQRRKLDAKRSDVTMTPEIAVHCLKGMRKEVLHSEGFAQCYAEYKKEYGAGAARVWANIDYDALTFAIAAVETLWYHRYELGS